MIYEIRSTSYCASLSFLGASCLLLSSNKLSNFYTIMSQVKLQQETLATASWLNRTGYIHRDGGVLVSAAISPRVKQHTVRVRESHTQQYKVLRDGESRASFVLHSGSTLSLPGALCSRVQLASTSWP